MTNILEFLENQAENNPDKIAFKDGYNNLLSFKELLENSKKIGSSLASFKANGAVAIHAKKSFLSLCAMFGAVQAGCFYSVIEPSLPNVRKNAMREILNPSVIICDNEIYNETKELFRNIKVFKISEILNSSINENILKIIRDRHISTNPLYCNFTSGSTGTPKGVLISHASVIDFIPIFCDTLGLKSSDIFANQAPFDFDVSVKDIYSTLFLGASCLLIPREYFTNANNLMDFIEDSTVLIWAVSALVFLSVMKALSYKKPNLRKIIYSGEIMPAKHIARLSSYLDNTEFINVYGPSEITCNATYHTLSGDEFENGLDIIGKAFANRLVFLIDENDKLIIETNIVGQICVSEICVGLGYLGGDNSVFCANELGQRYYKTGDLGYLDENNLLHFKGRKDHQIKRMGHRIELSEIEKMAHKLNGVEMVCAIYENDKLNVYYSGSDKTSELSEFLRENLPFYMIPNKLIYLKNMPINKNGKIDRNALKEMK
ncbi:AMP-binding protein [Campylobacter lanienae]|uniref:AMP-binding protein n=1 Tax=Campylobacter lanienae TaxID=75658 RepID=UPI000BB41D8F|nr:AMP-binding protein [Campylobacter lanienae]